MDSRSLNDPESVSRALKQCGVEADAELLAVVGSMSEMDSPESISLIGPTATKHYLFPVHQQLPIASCGGNGRGTKPLIAESRS